MSLERRCYVYGKGYHVNTFGVAHWYSECPNYAGRVHVASVLIHSLGVLPTLLFFFTLPPYPDSIAPLLACHLSTTT
jgi:hypothetical protein